jgi:hypothetical protein
MRYLFALLLFGAIAIVASGCSEANPGNFPAAKTPGATRDGVTPFIPNSDAKTAKLTAKAKAAIKATENIDPRGR